MNSLVERLSNPRMTLLSGLFLAASLAVLLGRLTLPLDPAWVTILISGTPLVYAALTHLIKEKAITSALLISIAMAASVAIGEVFAAGEVAFIMALGEMLEERTVARARKGIKQLVSLAPLQGRRLENGVEEIVPIEQIRKDDLLRILPGETIPVDGEIVSGNTSVDQSVMTGESLPVDKTEGDSVFSGTINRFGAIDIRAVKVGEDSSLQKLIRMVQEAESNQAPMQRIVDVWASWLVPIALLIAVATWFATDNIIRAVTVLVVFCPCALALATPTSIMAAIGQATRQGVLIKSGGALEIMGKVDCIALDKTGTLTHGTLTVSEMISFVPNYDATQVLQLAASVEAFSEHPLGKAIVAQARGAHSALLPVNEFLMVPGKGVKGRLAGKTILCGNNAWLEEHGVPLEPQSLGAQEGARVQGKASILVACDGACIGMVALSDTLRESAKSTVKSLRDMHLDVLLLTGDHPQTADYFARQAGIETVYPNLLPAEKVARIAELRKQGRRVCMIGDGVNDAPALKTADVGVAMGSMGSDIAIEAADIALMGDDIAKIPYLKKLSRATIRTIMFNISLSMLINFVAVGLSIAGVLTPVTGALVHNAGSVLVVLNAALLYDRKIA